MTPIDNITPQSTADASTETHHDRVQRNIDEAKAEIRKADWPRYREPVPRANLTVVSDGYLRLAIEQAAKDHNHAVETNQLNVSEIAEYLDAARDAAKARNLHSGPQSGSRRRRRPERRGAAVAEV